MEILLQILNILESGLSSLMRIQLEAQVEEAEVGPEMRRESK